MVYLAALLHDIGKPEAQCRGKREVIRTCITTVIPKKHGNRARYRDPGAGPAGVCDSVFRCTGALYYVKYHDDHVSVKLKHVRRHTKMASFAMFQNLMLLATAGRCQSTYPDPCYRRTGRNLRTACAGRKADFSIRKFWMGSRLMSRSCKTPVSKGRCKISVRQSARGK